MVEEIVEMIEKEETSRLEDFTGEKKEEEVKKPKGGRQLGRKGFLGFSINITITIFGFISMFFIKRYMGYEVVGMLAFATAYISLFAIIADLGFGVAHLKRVNEKELDEGKCNGTLITVKVILNFIMVGVLLATILIPKYFFDYRFESKTLELILYLAIVRTFLHNLISIFKNMTSAKLEIAKGTIPTITGRFVQMVMKISIAIVGLGAIYLVGAEIFASLLIVLMLYPLIRHYPISKTNRDYIKKYATFAIPVIFIGIVGTLAQSIDKVMIQFFVNSEAVGIYTIPQRITGIFLLVSLTITNLLFPTFSDLYSRKEFNIINRLSNEAVKYISITLIPAIIFFFIFAEPLMILVFGSDATKSVFILQVLLLAVYINAVRFPYSVQITSTGHLKLASKLTLLTLCMNIVLNFLFIPNEVLGIPMMGLGGAGAAVTTLVSLSVNAVLAKYFAFQITGTQGYRRIWKHFIAGGFATGIGYGLFQFSIEWYYLPAYFFLVIGLFLGVIILLKEFGKKELQFYFDTIHPGKMKRYMVDEIRNKN